MSMTLTVCDLIAEELISRLESLTVAGTQQTHVCEVIRPSRFNNVDWSPQDLQIVVTQSDPEIDEVLSYPGNPPATAWQVTFNLHLHLMPSNVTETPIDQQVNQFIADVRRVVCVPIATWHNFGGNAVDARWQSMELINGDSLKGVVMPLMIVYRTDENDPYQVRA